MIATSRRLHAGIATLTLVLAASLTPAAYAAHARKHHHHRAGHAARHHARASAKAKKGGGERKVEGSLDYELTPASSSLPATQTITLFLPGGVRVAGAKMPKCSPAALEKSGPSVCPKGSQIGTGSATGWTLGQLWPLTLTFYNGPGGNLLSYVTATTPVKIETVVEGHVMKPAGGTYGEEIVATIPSALLEPLPGEPGGDGEPARPRERLLGLASQHELRSARARGELQLRLHQWPDDLDRRQPQLRLLALRR